MEDRFRYAEVRQRIIDAIRMDLIGPREEEEVLEEHPRYAYLAGMLEASDDHESCANEHEQEIDIDPDYDNGESFVADEAEEYEPISTKTFQIPSSIGISFYIQDETGRLYLDVSWGDYVKSSEEYMGDDGKRNHRTVYRRHPMKETVVVDFSTFARTKDYHLATDAEIHVHVSRIALKGGFSLVSAYVINRRKQSDCATDAIMFQVEIKAHAEGCPAFVAEHICRKVIENDEFYFEQRPIMGRGRGCAAVWEPTVDGRTTAISSAFIPEYEFPGVSAALDGFSPHYFSTYTMAKKSEKDETIAKLKLLADSYEAWMNHTLVRNQRMRDRLFRDTIGERIVVRCQEALRRIRTGIQLVETDTTSFEAFCFMNRVIFLQNAIKRYAKKHGAGVACSFHDFVTDKKPENNFGWRPFQIAFILMNLVGIVQPHHEDREIVDLLYFPTGGGKTEAYLGLMAFVIANRRLRSTEDAPYNLDGGVTVILRYTLRLLTTQQRDRITKMVVAAEIIRRRTEPQFGKEPISIGFWVGGGVTPNRFDEFNEKAEKPYAARKAKNLVYKQLLTCPFCGKPLTETNFTIDSDRKSIEIFCSDQDCLCYQYRDDRMPIPVHLVDEEIYARCPTIILSTVDKFARLPWDVNTNALFGRVHRKCSRDGYVAIGVPHKRHNRTTSLPTSTIAPIRPFLPPELIIQDELHLITGPLGTIYGAYETVIEELCSHDGIKPKYVVSTATIKNAAAQVRCIYARGRMAQFPPNGFEIGDSFFIKEVPIAQDPFRKYVGICASGQSVKTALLRIYAIILQTTYNYALQDKYRDVIDPYYSLVGYFNSIRELGGTVRLLQDDIPKRIQRLKKRYGHAKQRYLNNKVEITSRMASSKIPEKLSQLELPYGVDGCLDTAIATNMIAVGMDVDRLGLMVVTGQPKQNAEYIQATSRIGRAFPGLVVTLYNPYRPRDLSHYENFTGYHAQLYRFVEGTTATPFSARARDRVLHALIISAVRLNFPHMADNADAALIASLTEKELDTVRGWILNRLNIVCPAAKMEAEEELERFIDWWKVQAVQQKPLRYYVPETRRYSRLINSYDQAYNESEKPTLRSMREVERAAHMFYYEEE